MQLSTHPPKIRHWLAAGALAIITIIPVTLQVFDLCGSVLRTLANGGIYVPLSDGVLGVGLFACSGAIVGAFTQALLLRTADVKPRRRWIVALAIGWPLLLGFIPPIVSNLPM